MAEAPQAADATTGRPAILVPHADDCVPRRAARMPRWMPAVASASLQSGGHPDYSDPLIQMAPDGGGVRKPFGYRNSHTTTGAWRSLKSGRIQYTEGPHERRYLKHLEAQGEKRDLQMQIARVSWRTRDGSRRSRVLDAGVQDDAGRITFAEVKAHWSFFQVQPLHDDLLVVESILAAEDVELERVVGTRFSDPVAERRVHDILASRSTRFDRDDVARAQEAVARNGGSAPLGRVREALHPNRVLAARLVDAMQVRSRLSFPIDRPITLDTPVRAVAPLPAGARRLQDVALGGGA